MELTSAAVRARAGDFGLALSGIAQSGPDKCVFPWRWQGLLNTLCRHAEGLGVSFRYEAPVRKLIVEDGVCTGAALDSGEVITARQFVITAGGFEANLEWLAKVGVMRRKIFCAGTPHNSGVVLKVWQVRGRSRWVNWISATLLPLMPVRRAVDGGIAAVLMACPSVLSLTRMVSGFMMKVKISGRNAGDLGQLMAQQPDQVAYAILDAQVSDHVPSVFSPISADTIEELALALGLDPAVLVEGLSMRLMPPVRSGSDRPVDP